MTEEKQEDVGGGIIYRDEHGNPVLLRTLTDYERMIVHLKKEGREIVYGNPRLSEAQDALFIGLNSLFSENRLNDGMLEIALKELAELDKQPGEQK